MKKTLIALTAMVGIHFIATFNAVAAPAKFYGTDYSGVYGCKGSNSKVGDYELTVTFTLNKVNSTGNIGHYDLSVQTENSTLYPGQAIVKGSDMALTIKFVDGNKLTFSTGLAKFKRIYSEDRHFSYTNAYFESHQVNAKPNDAKANDAKANDSKGSDPKTENKSSNSGSEECIQKPESAPAS
jgi:hypothetical protein